MSYNEKFRNPLLHARVPKSFRQLPKCSTLYVCTYILTFSHDRAERRRRIIGESREKQGGGGEKRKKGPESTRETRGGEWEKVNVIAVIFGRWLLPGSPSLPFFLLVTIFPPLTLPSSRHRQHLPLFLLVVLFVLPLSLSHLFFLFLSRSLRILSFFSSLPHSSFLSSRVHPFLPPVLLTPRPSLFFRLANFKCFVWQFARLDIRRPICRMQRSSCNDRTK